MQICGRAHGLGQGRGVLRCGGPVPTSVGDLCLATPAATSATADNTSVGAWSGHGGAQSSLQELAARRQDAEEAEAQGGGEGEEAAGGLGQHRAWAESELALERVDGRGDEELHSISDEFIGTALRCAMKPMVVVP